MRLVNSELRNNLSAFDYGERSLKKYSTQLSGLNKKFEAQKIVVEAARKQYEKLRDEKGENNKETLEAAARYNYEAASLNNLERHISKVTKEMQAFKREQEIQSTALWKTGDALERFGNKLEGISSKARTVGGTLSRYVSTPIAGIATVVGGMGFKRAMDIEQVQMMMEHISDSTEEYEKRMKNVVDLVTDTRFGTAEIGNEYAKFIGASASDVGAKLYSEVAMNLASFKSDDQLIPQIGDLFTKALQSGKIDGGMINQFTNAGVDILKVLGNKWGTTTEDVRKRLSEGSIDIHEVLDELSQGILEGTKGELGVTKAMGGMLEKSGRTLSGQLKNFFAAISQTGERLIKDTGLFDGVKDALDELRNMLKSGELDSILLPTFQGVSKAMEALVDIARKVFKWFSSLSGKTKEWIGRLVGFAAVIGPIITGLGIFGGILAKVSGGLGKFLKHLAPILKPLKGAGKSVGLLSRALGLLTGPVGIAIGIISLLVAGFITAYKKSDTFRTHINNLGKSIKEHFSKMMEWIRPGLDAVTGFFGEIKDKIVSFKNEEGAQLMDAFRNIGKFISSFASDFTKDISKAFNFLKDIVAFVMPFTEGMIKTVWSGIKSIITGTLDVIMGAIKVFSGLFTGDWKKMWEGVKQIGSGLMKTIWGFIKASFFGQIIGGLVNFVKNFIKNISDMWQRVRDKFFEKIKEIFNHLKNSFIGRIITNIIKFSSNFKENISNMWQLVRSAFKNKINEIFNNLKNSFIGRIITNIISFSSNFKKNMADMWQNVKNKFTTKISEIRTAIANSFVGRMLTSIRTLKTNFINIAKDMWAGVKKQFNNIVDGAKGLPKRIGDGIRNAKDKATSGMKSVGNAVIKWAGKPFNKVVDGVNFITGKLGIKTKIATWNYPQYAKGTDKKGHPGGPAIVGDGPGREIVHLPNGRSFISPDTDTLLNLPKGSHVIPNKPTEQIIKGRIPQYAGGTGLWENIKDVWSYMTSPSKLVNKVMDKISIAKNLAQIPNKIVSSSFNYVKTKPMDYVKNMFKQADEVVAAPKGGASAWRSIIYRAAARMNEVVTGAQVNGIIAQIQRESGGNEKIIQSSAVRDVNTAAGNPARGLLQYIPQTFNAYKVKGHGNIYSGYDQLLAFFNNRNWRRDLPYGRRGWGPTGGRKYATGGLIKNSGLYHLAENGWPEWVIPTDPARRSDAMKLLALAGKDIGNKRPKQLPNPSGSGEDDNYLKQLLEATLEQNQILLKLLAKDPTLKIGDYEFTKFVSEKADKGLNDISDKRKKAWGG